MEEKEKKKLKLEIFKLIKDQLLFGLNEGGCPCGGKYDCFSYKKIDNEYFDCKNCGSRAKHYELGKIISGLNILLNKNSKKKVI